MEQVGGFSGSANILAANYYCNGSRSWTFTRDSSNKRQRGLMRYRLFISLLTLMVQPLCAAPAQQIVREERRVTINGVTEVWRLIWRGSPKDSKDCSAQDPVGASISPASALRPLSPFMVPFAKPETGHSIFERDRAHLQCL